MNDKNDSLVGELVVINSFGTEIDLKKNLAIVISEEGDAPASRKYRIQYLIDPIISIHEWKRSKFELSTKLTNCG